MTVRLGNEAGVPSVPNVLAPAASFEELMATPRAAGLGDDLVVQTPYGDSGRTTFFVRKESDWTKHGKAIAAEAEVKIMKRVNVHAAAIEACITRHGTILGPLMTDLTGYRDLTPYKGGSCGNDMWAGALFDAHRRKVRKYVRRLGDRMAETGYRGFFEVDVLAAVDTEELYLGEINPRGGRWDYYLDSVWSAGQLDSSSVGDRHEIVLTPNSPQAAVVIKSFNFHPYYVSSERFTYDVSVVAGTTVVRGPTNVTFLSESTKVPVSLSHTGSVGQTLTLRFDRVASTLSGTETEGGGGNIAVDDITFAQLPETEFAIGPQVLAVTPANNSVGVAPDHFYSATVTNGLTSLVSGTVQLRAMDTPRRAWTFSSPIS